MKSEGKVWASGERRGQEKIAISLKWTIQEQLAAFPLTKRYTFTS